MTHTFKLTRDVTITSFPHYRRHAHFYYKVLNETHEVSISYFEFSNGEQTAGIGYDDIVKENTFREESYEITEQEFNEAFKKASDLINKMLGLQDF